MIENSDELLGPGAVCRWTGPQTLSAYPTELGKLRMGDKISYTEACTDEAGQTSIKFCLNSLRLQDPQRVLDGDDAAWVSTANDPSGKPLVERLKGMRL